MWPRNPNFGSLYRGFRYNGVHHIGVFTHTSCCNFASPKKYFVITGASVYRGSFYRGSTVHVNVSFLETFRFYYEYNSRGAP